MHRLKIWIVVAMMSLCVCGLQAASGKVIKVLPHLLDTKGRHTLSPSLYERDAYQAILRKDPAKCSGIRYDTQWKAHVKRGTPLTLRLELRTGKSNPVNPLVIEQPVKAPLWGSRWTGLTIDGERFKSMGNVIAWRMTLWNGDIQLGEQKSFMW